MSKYPHEVDVGEFKVKCLGLIDLVSEHKEEIIITKHGEPLVKLVPFEKEIPDLHGFLKGSVKIKGDIVRSYSKADRRAGWAEAAKKIAHAGEDSLVCPEFDNADDENLKW